MILKGHIYAPRRLRVGTKAASAASAGWCRREPGRGIVGAYVRIGPHLLYIMWRI